MKACENCINSTIVDWDWDEKNKKSIPYYYCEKHHISCDIIYGCDDLDTGDDILRPIELNKTALKMESWEHC